jgi:CHAT domain-containing protein/tetratricopeptide (TPR) repeat protein
VLAILAADPALASQIAQAERRYKVLTALANLGGVTSPGQIREIIRACPELVTDGLDAERGLHSTGRWPREGGRLAEARLALIGALTPSVTDTELESAYNAFDSERRAGYEQVLEAGHQKAHWLDEHPDAAAAEWDQVAVEALSLLGLGGDAAGQAQLLSDVGARVKDRPGVTPDQMMWAISCLRDSWALWRRLGSNEQAAAVGIDLGTTLYALNYGDVRAAVSEAQEVMREAVAYYEESTRTDRLAMAITNLAIILLKAATIDRNRDRIQEAVDLCRRAMPLRPKTEDPYGWAFTAANLALALIQLGAGDAATRRAHLAEAAATGEEAASVFDSQGDLRAADHARANRLSALLNLANELRDERLRVATQSVWVAIGREATDQASRAEFANLLDTNPAAFGLTETPPQVADIVRTPAGADEARLLKTVLGEAAAMLAEPRVVSNPAVRSRFAELTADAWSALLGPTQEAVDALAAAHRLIDETAAPNAAAGVAYALANLLARLGRWPEAAATFSSCLALHERMLQHNLDRDQALQMLARFPTLARWTAYAQVRAGDPESAVTTLERTRSRSLARIVRGAGPALEFLSWRSATLEDIGRAARPTCPIAYLLTAPTGSAVLLVHRSGDGSIGVTQYEDPLSSNLLMGQMFSLSQSEPGLLTAQRINADMGPAIRSIADSLGSLLQPVVDGLLTDGIQDLVVIPAGPAALLPWAAAMVRRPEDRRLTPVGELLTLSVAPSAAAVVLGRERAAGRVGDAAAGRLLVVADPERQDVSRLPGARDEARRIRAAFSDRVDVLAGPAARTDAVLERLPSCWVAHLACHGTNNVLAPQETRLLLSDGDITLDELLQLPELDARLVVLSACQTGQFDLSRVPDEMLGMPLAFLQAGACAVVSTLWPIDDRVTAMLIGRFYEELATGIGADGRGDIAAALTRAQRWLRSLTSEQARRWRLERGLRDLPVPQPSGSPAGPPAANLDLPFADPFFWAGFVAYGR